MTSTLCAYPHKPNPDIVFNQLSFVLYSEDVSADAEEIRYVQYAADGKGFFYFYFFYLGSSNYLTLSIVLNLEILK